MTMAEGKQGGNEAVSALVDGEVPLAEAGRIIDRVGADDDMRARWTRYHAGRAALAGHPARLSADFADRVHARLQAEPVIAGPLARRSKSAWNWRPSGQGMLSLAVAAGVGVVALSGLLALRGTQDTTQLPPSTAAPVAEVAPTERSLEVPTAGVPVPMLRPDGLATVSAPIRREAPAVSASQPDWLDEYVTSHAVMAAGGDMPGLIHSGRLAGYQSDR
jgi:negative regulator of sigma E activity